MYMQIRTHAIFHVTLMVKYSNVQKIMTFLMYAVLLALCKNLSAKNISAQS